ncbi:MAG: 2-(3-amino-3-carboxypropyl)histidine synthase subunit [Nanoarchaeota archaeon]|nr:2-(3-amino-3-carboxypropyl)histidine synthase subunit [Nanoarchaeota archaeon]
MQTLFIPAKRKIPFDKGKIKEIAKKLPNKIAIAYSIQYKDFAKQIAKQLGKGKVTQITQVLGCSKLKLPKKANAILLIGSGEFHALNLALQTKLPIYILDCYNLRKLSESQINAYKIRLKASYIKFLNADKIGILVSLKPGQQNLNRALRLRKHPKGNIRRKKSYIFLGDNINISEFENFSIGSWINTACPRLRDDNTNIVNIKSE